MGGESKGRRRERDVGRKGSRGGYRAPGGGWGTGLQEIRTNEIKISWHWLAETKKDAAKRVVTPSA